jgi:integrase
MTRKVLTDMMKRGVKAAGLGSQCVPHGLRKAVLRRLAERGSSTKEIAAVSGHKTLREVERYTRLRPISGDYSPRRSRSFGMNEEQQSV